MEIIQHHSAWQRRWNNAISCLSLDGEFRLREPENIRRWTIYRRLSQYVEKSAAVATWRKLSREINMEACKFA